MHILQFRSGHHTKTKQKQQVEENTDKTRICKLYVTTFCISKDTAFGSSTCWSVHPNPWPAGGGGPTRSPPSFTWSSFKRQLYQPPLRNEQYRIDAFGTFIWDEDSDQLTVVKRWWLILFVQSFAVEALQNTNIRKFVMGTQGCFHATQLCRIVKTPTSYGSLILMHQIKWIYQVWILQEYPMHISTKI